MGKGGVVLTGDPFKHKSTPFRFPAESAHSHGPVRERVARGILQAQRGV